MARPKKSTETTSTESVMHDDAEAGIFAAAQEMAAETLTGDMRDFVLQRLRMEQDKRPWNERSEEDQRQTVARVDVAMHGMVKRAVELIAGGGRRSIKATIEQITIKDGIKATLTMRQGDAERHKLFDAQGSRVLVIVADADEFIGERAPAEITPDQGALAVENGVVHSAPDSLDAPFH